MPALLLAGDQAGFALRPGANIVINAYDDSGARLDMRDFRERSRARVFLVHASSPPAEGVFRAMRRHVLDPLADQAPTALVVRPATPYKVFIEWTLPSVGRLLYALDNGGSGYVVDRPDGAIQLDLDREIARSSLAALTREGRGVAEADSAIAESLRHLQAGEADLAARPPDHRGAVRDFALSVKIALAARERLVLARANAAIDRNRKGQAVVAVSDRSGKPVPGAVIDFQQIDSDFMFGANPLGAGGSFDPRLAALMRDAGFNTSYITARWGRIESKPDAFDWSNIDSYQRPGEQLGLGFRLVGALSLWFAPNPDFAPRFLDGLGQPALEQAVYRYARQLAARYAGRIDVWELNELNLKGANALRLDWPRLVSLGRAFARAIKDGNPKARILNGSLALPYDVPESRPFPELLRSGIPTDMVGLEIYPAGVNGDGTAVVGPNLVAIDRALDRYEAFGKPVLVKEFSVPSAQVPGSTWWHGPWDEDRQAEFARDVFTIAFSKPMVCGISWSWGVTDQDAFIRHGGLINADLKPKKAYYALKSLLASWRSRGRVTTDRSGSASFSGFAGTYQIIVTRGGREIGRGFIHIREREQAHGSIRVSRATPQGAPARA